MEYRTFGRTGMRVSEIGFGAWAIGGMGWGGDVRDEESMAALEEAWKQGINLFDTADAYGNGHSERLLGEFLGGRRQDAVVVTKGGTNFRVPERSKNFSRDYLMMCLDESLERLRTDYVDVYLLHVPDSRWQDEAHVLSTLAEMKATGKARAVGLAMWGATDTLHALASDAGRVLDVIECPFNILNKSNPEVIRIAAERDIAVMTSEPLQSGILTGKYQSGTVFEDGDHRRGFWSAQRWAEIQPSLNEIEACAKENGMTMAELSLAYILSWPGVHCVIPGAKTPSQVRRNAAAAGKRISAQDVQRLFATKGFVY